MPADCPTLVAARCCPDPTCKSVKIAILDAVIQEVEESEGKLAATCQMPMEYAQGFVDHIRKLCREKGVIIR